MLRRFSVSALVGLLVVSLLPAASTAAPPSVAPERGAPERGPKREKLRWVPGEVVVSFERRADEAEALSEVGARTARRLPLKRTRIVELPAGKGVLAAVDELNAEPGVAFAEPNYLFELRETVPNDPFLDQMWGLMNLGQAVAGVEGTSDADVDASDAWDVETGDLQTLVGVIDDGFDIDHPDLAPNVVEYYDWGDKDDDPRQNFLDGHGTHVAGTVGAKGNNGIGVTGVNWDVGLVLLKVSNENGELTNAAIASAFNDVGARGARVVNVSLGGPGITKSFLQAITDNPETLYVVASGNSGQDNDKFADAPCDVWTLNVICVAAFGPFGEFLDFSHHGEVNVDIAAPGINVFSTQPYSVPMKSQIFDYPIDLTWTTGGTSEWGRESPPDYGFPILSDSPGAPYEPNTDSWAQYASPIDLSGESGCEIEWGMSLDAARKHARFTVEMSHDGSTWEKVSGHKGYSAGVFFEPITEFEGDDSVFMRFRFTANGVANKNGFTGVYVSDVKMMCHETPHGDNHYDFYVGTSMASPHVAGAAGLLFAHKPEATVEQVRWALLEGVDPDPTHTGKTASGGRLNVANSLALLDAAPADPYPDEGPVSRVRKVKLNASKWGKHLETYGRVFPADGHWACSVFAPVKAQRKTKKGWRTMKKTTTRPDGSYYARFKFRKGLYRVVAIPTEYDDSNYCEKAVSRRKRARR